MTAVNSSESETALRDAWRRESIVCVLEDRNANFRGIWYGDNPFDFILPTVMAKIVLVSVLSRLLQFLLKPLQQPRFVCYVLGGIIMGPSMLGSNKEVWKTLFPPREEELLLTMAILGGIYNVFLVGVKTEMSLVLRSTKNSWRIGLLGFTCSLLTSFGVMLFAVGELPGILLRDNFMFFVPLSLSYTYFPVLSDALQELGLLNTELGQLALSSAVLNDLIFWFFFGLAIAFKQETTGQAIKALLSFLLLLVFSVTVLRRSLVYIIKRTPTGKIVKEVYIVAVLLGVLVMAFVTSFLGVTPILGSLLLGMVIPGGAPLGSAVVQKTEAIVSEFLMPMFFVQVGYSVDINAIEDWPDLMKFQVVVAVACAAKFVGTVMASLTCKVSLKSAIVLGLIMNIKGILEILHYHRWRSNRYIDEQTYTQLILSTTATTMIVTPFIRLLRQPQSPLNPSSDVRGLRSLRSMPRNSEFRILCCIHGEENVHGIITLLEASNPSPASPICAYVVQISELTGLAAPLLVPYDRKRRKLKLTFSASTDQIVRAFENYSKNSRGPVVIMPFTMISSYKTMHETITRLSLDKSIPLLLLPFHRAGAGAGSASLRQFNVNAQAAAPCTVGILVDRGLSYRITSAQFAHHVAVMFVGGPDDREALALAARMADRQSQAVSVTVVRILLRPVRPDGEAEAEADESAAEDFRLRTAGNACAAWREVEVEDAVEAMSAVRAVEGQFDLVIVGKRPSWEAAGEDEMMSDFVENEELGVIGDMLASSDYCGGRASVLVVQHYGRERRVRNTYRSGSVRSNTNKSAV